MLSNRDRESLEISSFIFHVLIKDEEEPKFLDEVVLTNSQKNFFKKWFSKSVSNSIEYEFKDKVKDGSVYKLSSQIAGDEDNQFLEVSKLLTSEFKRFHKGSSSDGLVIISYVKVDSGNLLYLMKMDYSETLQYTLEERDGRNVAILEEVENPINENRQAIQKVAIVNIDCNYDWDVLAQDKQSTIGYKIAEYFKNFLDVREKEVASELTRGVFAAAKKWARSSKDTLDPEQNVTTYKGRALDYLQTHNEFDTDEFVNMVILDEVEERRNELKQSFFDFLEKEELAGRKFEIRPNSIHKRDSKSVWTTHNDVKIIFEGSPASKNISKETRNNEEIITIRTSNIKYD